MLSQEERINQSVKVLEIKVNELTQIQNLYTDGMFDGKVGLPAEYPEDCDYYRGWAKGHRIYECRKKGIELPQI